METNKDYNNNNIIIDLDIGGEELFMYSSSYLRQLEEIMSEAVLNW